MKRNMALAAAAVSMAFALGLPAIAATQGWLQGQKVTVGDIATTVNVTPYGKDDYQVQIQFQSKTYPVGCLSAYRDMRYELRDAADRVIPVDEATLQHPPYDGPSVLMHMTTKPSRSSCAANAPGGVWFVHAKLSALYPGLSPGTYTLKVSFAPHGLTPNASSPQAAFAPIAISINKHEK